MCAYKLQNKEAYIITYQHEAGHHDCDGKTRDAYIIDFNAAAAVVQFQRLYEKPGVEIRRIMAITLSDSRDLYNAGVTS